MSIPIFPFALKEVLCLVSRVPQLLRSAHSGLLLRLWQSLSACFCPDSSHPQVLASVPPPQRHLGPLSFQQFLKPDVPDFWVRVSSCPKANTWPQLASQKQRICGTSISPEKKAKYHSTFVCCSLGQKPSMDPPRLMQGSPYIWFQTIIHLINVYWQPTVCWRLTSKSHVKKSRQCCLIKGDRWPTPVFLPWKVHGQRSLVGCSPWGYMTDHVYIRVEEDELVAINW